LCLSLLFIFLMLLRALLLLVLLLLLEALRLALLLLFTLLRSALMFLETLRFVLLLRRALLLLVLKLPLEALRFALLHFIMLLRRALMLLEALLPGPPLRLSLPLFVAPCHGFVPRSARVVALRLQRRARAVYRRRPLHCRIVRRTTRRARGLLCHGLVLPRAACEVFVPSSQRNRVGCRRGWLWERPVAPARRCFARHRCRGCCPSPIIRSACGNPLSLLLLLKANPNSWCQEIRKLLGQQKIRQIARKSRGKYLNSAGSWSTFVCDAPVSQKGRKILPFFFPSRFYFLEIPGKKSRF
jgi:hypothetical protein